MAFSEYTETEIRIFLVRFCHENGKEMTKKVHQGLATVAAEQRLSALKRSIDKSFAALGLPCLDDMSNPGSDYDPDLDTIINNETSKAYLDKKSAKAGIPLTGELSSDSEVFVELSSTKRKRATTGRGASAANKKKKKPATRRKRAAKKPYKPGQMVCMYCYSDFNSYIDDDKRACRSHHGRIDINNAQGYWDALGYTDLSTVERSDENLEQNPLGFKWTCCGRKGSSKGCRLRAHAGSRTFGSFSEPAASTARKDDRESASEASVCDTASEAES